MLKVCIIGGSGHYRYVLEGLDDRVQLAGIAPGSADEDMSKLSELLIQRQIAPKFCDRWRDMLDELHPDIVAVNCHFGDHAEINMACLQRGIHTFAEKPVATTLDDLWRLKALYTQGQAKFSAMFGIRYAPWFLTAHAAIAQGRIGTVRLMQAQKSYKLGSRPAFFSKRKSYGGTILWVGSHAIDWLHWLSGESFRSVFATHSTQHNQDNGELEISAQCQFTLSNAVCGSVSIDYLRPPTAPSHDDDRIRIAGTRGVLEVHDEKVWLTNDEASGMQQLPLLPRQFIFKEFIDEVLGTGRCMVTAEDAFVITEASLLARQSADEGRLLRFRPVDVV